VTILANDTFLYDRRSDVVFTSSYSAYSRLLRRGAHCAIYDGKWSENVDCLFLQNTRNAWGRT